MRGALGFVISIAVAACGAQVAGGDQAIDPGKGDDPQSGGESLPPSQPLTPSTFLIGVGQVECDHAFVCRDAFPVDAGFAFEQEFGNTPDECYLLAQNFYRPDEVEQSVDQGRIDYDADEAQRCVDGITFPSDCDDYWELGPEYPNACDAALLGLVDDGDACTTDFDCESSDCLTVCIP